MARLNPRQSAILGVRWIAKNLFAATDQNRQITDAHLESVEQCWHVGFGVDVDVAVRMAIARQERLHAQG